MKLWAQGERRFGAVNWRGLTTLVEREILRFLKVAAQTLLAPIATAALFLVVFDLAFSARLSADRAALGDGASFVQFLAPGVIMMTVIQNAFANTSSSIMGAKTNGNIVDSLTPPLSAHELTLGYAIGGVARGLLVAVVSGSALLSYAGLGGAWAFMTMTAALVGAMAASALGQERAGRALLLIAGAAATISTFSAVASPLWTLVFALIGSFLLALIGVAGAIWAQKFDHLAAVTNFIVTPLSFLSGTFYSASRLPEPWSEIVLWNPVFYLIDGFRYGVLGASDVDPWASAAVGVVACVVAYAVCWRMFATGYRIKS